MSGVITVGGRCLPGLLDNGTIKGLIEAAQYLNDRDQVNTEYLKGMADLIAFMAGDVSHGPLSSSTGVVKHILIGVKGWHRESLEISPYESPTDWQEAA